MTATAPERTFEIDIAAPVDEVWDALTDFERAKSYYFGTGPRTTWEVGSPIEFVSDDGEVQITGVLVDVDEPRTLAHTFIATWYDTPDDQGSLHWRIEETDGGSHVTLTHRGARDDTREGSETAEGSRELVDGLKRYLEGA